jgi:hypothetical protein
MKTEAAVQSPGQASPPAPGRSAAEHRSEHHSEHHAEHRAEPLSLSEDAPKTSPLLTGHSFLGLSTPGPASDGHTDASAGRDPLQPSSRNLDYLLEDEEEPKRSWGKLILIVLALALALGFGYLHWKQGGFDWLSAGNKKPATSDAVPNADSASPAAQSAPAEPPATQPAVPQSSPSQPVTAPNPQNAPAQNPVPENPVPQSKPSDSTPPADSASQPASSDSAASPSAETPAPKTRPRKPAPPKPAAKPFDAVSVAEGYIYGHGVRQDCDHGLHLLKTATAKSNPKAMISMGALYSTGTCTPRDLPTAYRWFALALHQQPDNQVLQDDLKNLWEKMTPPERQLAIKLSQ